MAAVTSGTHTMTVDEAGNRQTENFGAEAIDDRYDADYRRNLKRAQRGDRRHGESAKWLHREVNPKEKTPCVGRDNPNVTPEHIADAFL